MRLVGTTKSTIAGIRDRTHWNAAALQPLDPVTLGLCSQIDLDFEVAAPPRRSPSIEDRGATLLPAAVTTAAAEAKEAEQRPRRSPPTSSTSMRCSPSSSSSASRTTRTSKRPG